MIYFLSDPHFGHPNILEYEPKRKEVLGETIEQHDAALIKRINYRVKADDILFILGDFSLCSGTVVQAYREQILCKKVSLILGNHDKHSVTYYYKCGFSVVCYEMVLKIAGEFVRLRHHPYKKPWYRCFFPWQYREKDRKKRPVHRGGFLLHGHIHSGGHKGGAWKVRKKMINVGVDVTNYYPISIREIESLISREKNKETLVCYVSKKIRSLKRWMQFLTKI